MKIMKSVDKKVGDITYYKYKINLPKKVVEESNFEDKELEVKIEKDKLIIKKKKPHRSGAFCRPGQLLRQVASRA